MGTARSCARRRRRRARRGGAQGYPARPSSSATRSRLRTRVGGLGRLAGGGLDAALIRNGGAFAEDLHGEVPHGLKHSARPARYSPRSPPIRAASVFTPAMAPGISTARGRLDRAPTSALLGGDAAGFAHAGGAGHRCRRAGSGSSENQESAMKRPVPDGHMTSPPHSVSMPRMALPTRSSYWSLMLLFSFRRSDPNQR